MTAAGFRLPGGESTSARLRHVEQERDDAKTAFAASQADLTHVERQLADAESDRMKAERERDEANELTDKIAAELRGVTRERDALARRCAVRFEETQALKADLTQREHELAHARFARDMATTRLAYWRKTGQDVIAQPGWIVARGGGRDCTRCGQEIRRGEAYELMPGVDQLQHIRCQYRTEGAPMTSTDPGGEGGNFGGTDD